MKRLVNCLGDFVTAFRTAPLLSRLGLARGHFTNRAATVMERSLNWYRNHRDGRLVAGAILVTAAAAAGVLLGANKFGAPRTIVQVVAILWKEDSTLEQQQACLEGVR